MNNDVAKKLTKLCEKDFINLINTAFTADYLQLNMIIEDLKIEKISTIDHDMNSIKVPTVLSIDSETKDAFPLRMRHAPRYISKNVALIGWVALIWK
jgi:2-polyprenyl-6-methoxyphenol hydroxylase-like FAD-dependent oxidoreductase